MTTDTTTLEAFASPDAVAERDQGAGLPSWLAERRHAAAKRFADQAWPNSRQDEFWRNTRFDRLPLDLPVVTGSDVDASQLPGGLAASVDEPAGFARLVDGRLAFVELADEVAAAGVVVSSLARAAETHADLVREHLGSLTTSGEGSGADEDRTITANDAAWTDGVFVHVPAEVEVDGPLGIRIHVTQPGTHLPRVLVVAGHHAKATIYLEHSSDLAEGEQALVDEVVEVVVQDSARIDVLSLQEWGDGITHLGLQKTALHRGAMHDHLAVTIGGKVVRLRPEVDLLGPGAETRPSGIYVADEGQHFDLQPYMRHLTPHATSDVLYKGALQGRSRTIFRGNVYVRSDAVGTDTNETNRTMILTAGARAESTPFLEIECADISAGHGSATGQIDASYLYYLQSRGISREDALRLIVMGFFTEVLDRVDMPGVAARTTAHLEEEVAHTDLDALAVSAARPAHADAKE